jgi:hypothetical protein
MLAPTRGRSTTTGILNFQINFRANITHLQCPGCVECTSGYYDFLSRIGSIWSSLRASRTRIVGIWAFSVKEINPNCSWVAYEGGLAESYLGYEGESSDVRMIFLSAVGESCVLPSREGSHLRVQSLGARIDAKYHRRRYSKSSKLWMGHGIRTECCDAAGT